MANIRRTPGGEMEAIGHNGSWQHVPPSAAEEIERLAQIIGDLIAEPRRSRDIISRKVPHTDLMTATFTKGQVLAAIDAIKVHK